MSTAHDFPRQKSRYPLHTVHLYSILWYVKIVTEDVVTVQFARDKSANPLQNFVHWSYKKNLRK